MKKLINNLKAEKIQRLHTKEEIKNGIITLKRVKGWDKINKLLYQKLLEEVSEFYFAETEKRAMEELEDIITVCLELLGKTKKYSKGYVLVNTRDSLQKK